MSIYNCLSIKQNVNNWKNKITKLITMAKLNKNKLNKQILMFNKKLMRE